MRRLNCNWRRIVDPKTGLTLDMLLRLASLDETKQPLIPLSEVAAKAGITAQDLEAAPDVELEDE